MLRPISVLSTTLIALFAMAGVQAAELGEPAAPLQIKTWSKGEAVSLEELKGDKVAVIEFWATWCGPCRQSIPHLTEMQEKYKDKVVFIGISDEEASVVDPFVESMGDQMEYTVAVDNARATSTAYMQAYGVSGIPHAFIVDQEGLVAFHAHPMDPAFEQALEMVIAGNFDAKAMAAKAKKREEALEKANEYLHSLAMGENVDNAESMGAQVVEAFAEDAEVLNQIAWIIATGDFEHRDLKTALKAAEQAVRLTDREEAAILNTHAQVLFMLDETEQAIKIQREAISLAKTDEEKQYLQEQLDSFENPAEEDSPAS